MTIWGHSYVERWLKPHGIDPDSTVGRAACAAVESGASTAEEMLRMRLAEQLDERIVHLVAEGWVDRAIEASWIKTHLVKKPNKTEDPRF